MKYVIGLVVIVGLSLGAWQLHQYFGTFQPKPAPGAAPAPPPVYGDQLSGLPRNLEAQLQDAEQRGAPAMKRFLAAHAHEINDPRRAWIELDYVVLAGASDPGEARLVFQKVKARLAPGSPVYARMKQLEPTYE
ncbi:MAG TPA: hypothetical protein VGO59_09240 [Verrucomicrobiae bacterium]|jgi:hypothetical protein